MNHFSDLQSPESLRQYAIQGNAILGIRGSGKSWTGKVMAESLLDQKIPWIAFDPIGVWRHMKLPNLTGGRGFKVVVAGDNGDLPLTPESAPQIVRAAMHENIPLVIDLFSMRLSKEDWRKIVHQSVEILLHENVVHGIRHIFLEEAAEFCPQRVQPAQGLVYSTIEKLARMGGNASLGFTLINQRAEEVNKAVLELCDLLFLHRQKGKNSLHSLEKWIGFLDERTAKQIVQTLPTLESGHCYIWREQAERPVQVKVPLLESFHPDRKNPVAARTELATNVADFITRIQKVVTAVRQTEPVKKIADFSLKAEVDRLQGEVDHWMAEAHKPRVMPVTLGQMEELRNSLSKVKIVAQEAGESLDRIIIAMTTAEANGQAFPARMPRAPQPMMASARSSTQRRFSQSTSGIKRMMIAIAQRPGLNRKQLGLRAGLSSAGGTFGTYLGKIRSSGWLCDLDDGGFKLTEAGLKELGRYEKLPEGEDLREYWLAELGDGGASRMLRALCEVYPNALSREELGERAGMDYKGGSFGTYLGRLRTLELVVGGKTLKASEELF